MLARNVTVVPLAAPVADEPGLTLADLAVGQQAEVVGISLACQGPQRRRLLDLGVVPGTVIWARSPVPPATRSPTTFAAR